MSKHKENKGESLFSGFWVRLLIAAIIVVAVALGVVLIVRYG